ncbi:NAD(P)/FAD-dependent oxidoreductase [Methylobacterium dankookense]|uniref:D-amino acid dehydrogenase 1 n=1 Tax=Methylobacterium dankookense TaxID=560405 RepID=A0A564FXV0_9HYPH|nr:FAD-dependent oxidoreductase [Methylobacterium dankookense]GJD55629.1 D-amino acid dehydrogenase 1 [Methylobacterium dankookense]VUF12817.1 D-amino acid dehydrogenase 1 [Methylobacterium dankookense]
MSAGTGRHVVVIGSGAVGTVSALECLRAGHRVTVVDPGQPGGEQASSYGNAGWLSSHSVIPPAEPGMWRKVPSFLLDPLGPLSIRWAYLPKVLPWLVRFLLGARNAGQIERTAQAMRTLLVDAPKLHAALAAEAGVPHLIERRGVLHVYPDRAAFAGDARSWALRRRVGVDWLELTAEELRQREPELHPRYTFGLVVEEARHCRDPGSYVAALSKLACERGAAYITTRATGFRHEGGRLKAVTTEQGEIACDRAVVAAGARSKALTASLGDRLPLESERGYHVMIPDAEAGPRTPVMASDAKMIANFMDGGLRAAGQVEFAGLAAAPNWKRADILRDHLIAMFPKLAGTVSADRLRVWLGHRPSMPDGRPCIGPARTTSDVIYAFGHGHVGLVGSARTGRLVAQLVSGAEPEITLAPFDPRRFL